MLFWRLVIGIPIVLFVLGLSWLDVYVSRYGLVWLPQGIVLIPPYLVCLYFLTKEFLGILNAAGLHPRRSTVYLGNLLIALSCWLANVVQQYKLEVLGETISPHRGWQWASTASVCALLAVAAGIILSFAAEMRRYTHPGGVTINLAGAVFAIAYLGLLSCFMIQLHMAYGIGAMLSLVVVVKLSDSGAYAVGKLFGRHKITPGLSPGKTLEGCIGGILFACAGAWFWFEVALPYYDSTKPDIVVFPRTPPLNWLIFGVTVSLAGMVGDLAGSLIKRDTQLKDSGHTIPGFGGILDLFDSLLMAAPVVYVFWATGIVCPGYH